LHYGSGHHYNAKVKISETEYIDVIINKVMLLYHEDKKLMLTHYKKTVTRDSAFDWEDEETFIETFSSEYSLNFDENAELEEPKEPLTDLEKFLKVRTDSENRMAKKYDNFTFNEDPFVRPFDDNCTESHLEPMHLDDAMGIINKEGKEILDDESWFTNSGMMTKGDGYFYVPDNDKIWECKPDTIEYNMILAARPLMEKRAFENG
jgi:hypothetical protein